MGLDPTRSPLRKILSLVRLPFRHFRTPGFRWKPDLIISLEKIHCNNIFPVYTGFCQITARSLPSSPACPVSFLPISKQSNVAK